MDAVSHPDLASEDTAVLGYLREFDEQAAEDFTKTEAKANLVFTEAIYDDIVDQLNSYGQVQHSYKKWIKKLRDAQAGTVDSDPTLARLKDWVNEIQQRINNGVSAYHSDFAKIYALGLKLLPTGNKALMFSEIMFTGPWKIITERSFESIVNDTRESLEALNRS